MFLRRIWLCLAMCSRPMTYVIHANDVVSLAVVSVVASWARAYGCESSDYVDIFVTKYRLRFISSCYIRSICKIQISLLVGFCTGSDESENASSISFTVTKITANYWHWLSTRVYFRICDRLAWLLSLCKCSFVGYIVGCHKNTVCYLNATSKFLRTQNSESLFFRWVGKVS